MPLSLEQVDAFWKEGYLVMDDALSPEQLLGLRAQFAEWVEESRTHSGSFGQTIDGRPRFDLASDHSAERPALRRISSPAEVSDIYADAMRDNRALDALTQIFGSNIKLNNTKVNSKLPGTATEVKYHQDFLFEPHSNYDLAACLFFLDDVDEDNGPLEVVPGTHTGPLFELWHDGVFTGAVADSVEQEFRPASVHCTGKAGSVCIMHGRLLHGSMPNNSANPRTLYIVAYSAEDAILLGTNHIPSAQEGEVVRGVRTNRVRSAPYEMSIPEYPKQASFFGQQAPDSETID
jgi:ectoine hydroxylase-related dioxygenase (phytanoyl-CoA dioxygenase family)